MNVFRRKEWYGRGGRLGRRWDTKGMLCNGTREWWKRFSEVWRCLSGLEKRHEKRATSYLRMQHAHLEHDGAEYDDASGGGDDEQESGEEVVMMSKEETKIRRRAEESKEEVMAKEG